MRLGLPGKKQKAPIVSGPGETDFMMSTLQRVVQQQKERRNGGAGESSGAVGAAMERAARAAPKRKTT